MDALLGFLAVFGGVALVVRIAGSLFRLIFQSARASAAGELARVSARHGDLSALAERQSAQRTARRARGRDLLLLLLWFALLIVPPLVGWEREVYAAAALLWFLPLPRFSRAR